MSNKEIDRYIVLQKVKDKALTQAQAAQALRISIRHIRNLLAKVKLVGKKGLISKKRGAPSNHRLPPEKRAQISAIIRASYSDFGPTLACEKLMDRDGIKVSVETVRSIMIESQLWFAKKSRRNVHQRRERRACFGELIQADASSHDWFEGRREKCSLTVLVDDATSMITALHFTEAECLDGYNKALEQHLMKYGRPLALYTDRHAIFKTTRKSGKVNFKDTRLKKTLTGLEIDLILAHSPQAKGRVERANQTLQDRLIKELRLLEINTLEEANGYLPKFIEEYNKKFGREPLNHRDVHRDLLPNIDLKRTLCPTTTREVSKDLTFQYKNTIYQIKDHSLTELRGKKVQIKQVNPGAAEVWYKEKLLEYTKYSESPYQEAKPQIKTTRTWGIRRKYVDKTYHPWKKYLLPGRVL